MKPPYSVFKLFLQLKQATYERFRSKSHHWSSHSNAAKLTMARVCQSVLNYAQNLNTTNMHGFQQDFSKMLLLQETHALLHCLVDK